MCGVYGDGWCRIEHLNDPQAPPATRLVPAASAIVADAAGRILLQRRTDNALWSIPGGAMEVGESIAQTAVREVKEETGLEVAPERLVGIYSNPRHVVEYADGEVRQQFSTALPAGCSAASWRLATSRRRWGSSPRQRSRPCRCTSRSACGSATTSSAGPSRSSPDYGAAALRRPASTW
jgi:ADP-ribose pyrophosphatase YjhB (NUDIX family)